MVDLHHKCPYLINEYHGLSVIENVVMQSAFAGVWPRENSTCRSLKTPHYPAFPTKIEGASSWPPAKAVNTPVEVQNVDNIVTILDIFHQSNNRSLGAMVARWFSV